MGLLVYLSGQLKHSDKAGYSIYETNSRTENRCCIPGSAFSGQMEHVDKHQNPECHDAGPDHRIQRALKFLFSSLVYSATMTSVSFKSSFISFVLPSPLTDLSRHLIYLIKHYSNSIIRSSLLQTGSRHPYRSP